MKATAFLTMATASSLVAPVCAKAGAGMAATSSRDTTLANRNAETLMSGSSEHSPPT
jgi:predicted nicotinamide N-methyase